MKPKLNNLNECRLALEETMFKGQRERDYLADQTTIRQNMNAMQFDRIRPGHGAEYYNRLTDSSLTGVRPVGSDGAGVVHRTLR